MQEIPWLWGLAALPFVIALVCCGILVVLELAFLHFRSVAGRPSPSQLKRWIEISVFEVFAMWVLVWWRFRGAFSDRPPRREKPGPLVVAVHGYLMTGTNMWGIRKAVHAAGGTSMAISLGGPARPMEHYARIFAEKLRRVGMEERPIHIVAHSMGGLVAARALADNPDLARRVRKFVTLGTPHRGTAISLYFPITIEARQMKPGSDFYQDLPSLRAILPHAEVSYFRGEHDFVVYPEDTCAPMSHLPDILPGTGHAGMLVQREAIDLVVRRLLNRS